MDVDACESSDPTPTASRLSYKFQRLRERIRAAIDAGELVGKLPGERSLARKFNVNAKTLSKALTDLAAEGVLQRNIGLGTFVRGADLARVLPRVLLLAEAGGSLHAGLRAGGLDVQSHADTNDLPPSLLAPFDVIVVDTADVDDRLLRDLIVRGKAVITVDRTDGALTTHVVLAHEIRAGLKVARRVAELGHRRVLVVRPPESETDIECQAMAEAMPQVEWRSGGVADTVAAAVDGFTAAVCVSETVGRQVVDACRAGSVSVPDTLSVVAFGRKLASPVCSGHFVTGEHFGAAIAAVLHDGLPYKPLTLWLGGEWHDAGTLAGPRSGQTRRHS